GGADLQAQRQALGPEGGGVKRGAAGLDARPEQRGGGHAGGVDREEPAGGAGGPAEVEERVADLEGDAAVEVVADAELALGQDGELVLADLAGPERGQDPAGQGDRGAGAQQGAARSD